MVTSVVMSLVRRAHEPGYIRSGNGTDTVRWTCNTLNLIVVIYIFLLDAGTRLFHLAADIFYDLPCAKLGSLYSPLSLVGKQVLHKYTHRHEYDKLHCVQQAPLIFGIPLFAPQELVHYALLGRQINPASFERHVFILVFF